MLNIILFVTLFLIIVNWFQIRSFSGLLIGPKTKTSLIKDDWIIKTVKKKTGLLLLDITLFHDKKMYGMMAGLPFWPKMILSTELYKSFNKNELEWVILHEAAHCIFWHNLQSFLIELLTLTLGIYLIQLNKINFINIPILSILLSIICIQIIRWTTEFTADSYSINRVDNPKGVITAQAKFKKNYKSHLLNNEKNILRYLFHWNITYSQRIELANKRLIDIKC